jgi:DNA-binding NtrC family response regulator
MVNLLEKVIYNSEIMQQRRKELGPFIESSAPILFWGESGSGMGFYARAIHEASARTGKFLRISGFSLDEDTVKQQFLGIDDEPGWLEKANAGTIFLKRFSEVSSVIQQFLVQLIGNQSVDGRIEFSRRGRTDSLEVNVRFIYSMAYDLTRAMQDNLLSREFVEEIKKRGKIIHLPPLRERKEDIIRIAQNFFEQFNQAYDQHISSIDEEAQTILTNHNWLGNIGELKRVIEWIFAQYPGITTITAEHIPDHLKNPEVTGDKYSFRLKDDVKFVGRILSSALTIQTESKKLTLKTEELLEIVRVENGKFTPPKFKHFVFKLKDGSQIIGKILTPKMTVETSFDPDYEINTQDLYSVFLS